jgi:glycosyltransferase involved in cell wall biosynthesis
MSVNISNALAEENHEVILISTRASGNLTEYLNLRVKQYSLGKKSFFDISSLFKLKRLIEKYKPEVMHAHSSSIFWAVIASILARSSGKIIWHDHNGKRAKNSWLSNRPYVFISIFIDRIICVNEELLQWSKKYMWVGKNSIYYLPNFPHLKKINHFNSKNEKIYILNIANLREPKDHLNLLKAIKILLESAPSKSDILKLLLVGKKNTDSDYYKDLELFIQQNDLSGNVDFVGETQNVEKYLFESNIGVISSKSEGLPVSLLEYGLAGLPVVVTDVGQCAEVIGHGEYGKLVPPQNPEALANALESIIRDSQNAAKMGQAFKYRVEQNYGAQAFLKSYMDLLLSP